MSLSEGNSPRNSVSEGAQALLPRSLVKQFHRRRDANLEGLIRVLVSAVLFCGAAVVVVVAPHNPLAILAAAALGLFQTNWYEAMHWAVHRTLFRSRLANQVVGHVAGFITFWPFLHYRDYHLDHHRFTGRPVRDPELLTGVPTEVPSTVLARLRHVGTASVLFFSANLMMLLRLSIAPSEAHRAATMPYIRPSTYRGLALECRLSLLGYAAVIAGLALAVPLALPYLPFVLWFHCTTMLVFALPEHAGLHGGAQHEAGDEDDDLDGREPRKEPNAVAQLAMTRQFRSNFVYRYLAWNGNYHAAHHAYPSVPYYAISALSKALGPRIANQYGGYLGWYARADRTRVESEASAELA